MRLFAIRAAPKKVNVNVVIPGVTETEAWYRFGQQRGFAPEQMLEMMRSRAPSGEVISPREIGAVVSFLCSASGKHITGISLPVDGGLHLGAPPPTGQWTADGKGSAGGAQGDEKTSAPSQGTKTSRRAIPASTRTMRRPNSSTLKTSSTSRGWNTPSPIVRFRPSGLARPARSPRLARSAWSTLRARFWWALPMQRHRASSPHC